MTDQMRGDCIGIAGHPYVKTPYLDTLAVQGVRFRNAYTAVPSCIAARAAMLTGCSQDKHGRVGYRDCISWENYDVTLPGSLADAGYYTQCVGKMHVHPPRLTMGFHNVELHDGYIASYRRSDTPHYLHQKAHDDYLAWLREKGRGDIDILDSGLDANSWVSRPWPYAEELHPTNWVAARSIDFLRRRDTTKPFFLMASFVRPHPPFDAPQAFFDMYSHMDMKRPAVGDWADKEDSDNAGRVYNTSNGILDDELMRRTEAGYYACISHVDNQIGRLLGAVRDYGLYSNTIIVFISDHGEMLGEHNMFRKIVPYNGSIGISMIFSGVLPKDIGCNRVNSELAELRDIMPTLLDLAGADIPESIDGKSLVPAMKREGETVREYLHGEHSGGGFGNHFIVTKTDKYIWYSKSGHEQYFNLSDDPGELHDLAGDPAYKHRIDELRGILIAELSKRNDPCTNGRELIAGFPSEPLLSM